MMWSEAVSAAVSFTSTLWMTLLLWLLCCRVQTLLDVKVGAAKEACVSISTEATQEAALEELLAKVTTKWAGIEFTVIPYKDSKDVYILGAIDEIQVRCLCLKRSCVPCRLATAIVLYITDALMLNRTKRGTSFCFVST
jgi:hypothetical protein